MKEDFDESNAGQVSATHSARCLEGAIHSMKIRVSFSRFEIYMFSEWLFFCSIW